MAKRSLYYATVVYPESAPDNWLEILDSYHFGYFVSPLHDEDVNPDGVIKKAHYHVMFLFDSLKSEEQFFEIRDAIGGVGREIVSSCRGYARYLCHLDNPEKVQYNISEVKSGGGANYDEIIGLPSDKYQIIGEMMDWCVENQCYSYFELIRYARLYRSDWYRGLCDNCTSVIKEFLKSYLWDSMQSSQKIKTVAKTNEKKSKKK